VWSSDLRRAVETAGLAVFDPVLDRRLREFDFGELEGRTWNDLDEDTARRLLAFDDYEAPGGETVPQLRARLDSFVADLTEGDHLVFTHGGVIRALLRGSHIDRRVDPGDIVVIEVA
jgi:probable phosphoglycerate mutase